MDERRQDTSLTDEGIDRALGELLHVAPSVDFVARVRTRIDNEPASSGWLGTRFVVVAAAVACFGVGVAIWTTIGDGEQPLQPPVLSVAQAPVKTPVTPEVPSSPTANTGPAVDAAVPAAPQTRVASSLQEAPLPPVLVSPAEIEALRYFVSALREGRVDPGTLPADTGELESPMPIVIEPITVEPLLTAGDIEIGELQ